MPSTTSLPPVGTHDINLCQRLCELAKPYFFAILKSINKHKGVLMNIMQIAMLIFLVIESLNIATLYFNPGSKIGNGIGVFNAFEKSKENEEIHRLVRYLVFWVAGTKLIFVALLLVIIFTAPATTQFLSVIVLILSILSFYWRLDPIIKKMDANNQITPKGYSKGLHGMISFMIIGFAIALMAYVIK
jgi:hypothetical protein